MGRRGVYRRRDEAIFSGQFSLGKSLHHRSRQLGKKLEMRPKRKRLLHRRILLDGVSSFHHESGSTRLRQQKSSP